MTGGEFTPRAGLGVCSLSHSCFAFFLEVYVRRACERVEDTLAGFAAVADQINGRSDNNPTKYSLYAKCIHLAFSPPFYGKIEPRARKTLVVRHGADPQVILGGCQ